MSRKAAPKPEELIQKLEEKVDKFKVIEAAAHRSLCIVLQEEVTDRLGEQAAGVAKLQASHSDGGQQEWARVEKRCPMCSTHFKG